jgi:hypothetical protein
LIARGFDATHQFQKYVHSKIPMDLAEQVGLAIK